VVDLSAAAAAVGNECEKEGVAVVCPVNEVDSRVGNVAASEELGARADVVDQKVALIVELPVGATSSNDALFKDVSLAVSWAHNELDRQTRQEVRRVVSGISSVVKTNASAQHGARLNHTLELEAVVSRSSSEALVLDNVESDLSATSVPVDLVPAAYVASVRGKVGQGVVDHGDILNIEDKVGHVPGDGKDSHITSSLGNRACGITKSNDNGHVRKNVAQNRTVLPIKRINTSEVVPVLWSQTSVQCKSNWQEQSYDHQETHGGRGS